MNQASKILLAAVVPVLGLSACGGDSNVAQAIGTADPQVRFADASPMASNLTLQRNNATRSEASNVSYGDISNYFNVDTGTADWRVSGTASSGNAGTAFAQTINFDAQRGHRYTIVAVADSASSTSLALLNDPTNVSIVNDNSRVRVFNASFNAQNIDVYTIGLNQDIGSLNPDLTNVGFRNSGPSDGTDALKRRGGDYKIVVTAAGTKNVLFQGKYTIRDSQDVLFVTVPVLAANGQAATGVNVLVKQNNDASIAVPAL